LSQKLGQNTRKDFKQLQKHRQDTHNRAFKIQVLLARRVLRRAARNGA
jgi:hypothetical protein